MSLFPCVYGGSSGDSLRLQELHVVKFQSQEILSPIGLQSLSQEGSGKHIQRRESAATLCRKDRHCLDTMLITGG